MNQLNEAAYAGALRVLDMEYPEGPPEYAIVDHVHDMLMRNHPLNPKPGNPTPASSIGQAIVNAYLAAEQYMVDNAAGLKEGDPAYDRIFQQAVEVGKRAGLSYLTGR